MTQIEQILFELDKIDSRGLTSTELGERTEIPAGTLRTTLYELQKKEFVRKAGGKRGSYRYAITSKGRTELHSRQPLARTLTHAPNPRLNEMEEEYEGILQLIGRMDELRILRRFVAFLVHESDIDLSGNKEITIGDLQAEIMRFLGVDPHDIDNTLEELDTLVTTLRSTM